MQIYLKVQTKFEMPFCRRFGRAYQLPPTQYKLGTRARAGALVVATWHTHVSSHFAVMTQTRVGIVGTGGVGSTLGGRLLRHPADFKAVDLIQVDQLKSLHCEAHVQSKVMAGSRHPTSNKVKQLLTMQPGSTADTVHNVVKSSSAVILATPGSHDDAGIHQLAASLGPDIRDKVLIDVTNPLTEYPGLEVRWTGKSAGEVLAEALPGTLVYKAFNTVPFEHMQHPDGQLITGVQLTQLFAGPPEGKELVEKIIAGVGFKPEYVGPIRYARNLEALAELVIHLGVPGTHGGAAQWGRNIHFQALRGPSSG